MVSGRVSLANRYFASLRAHAEFVRSHFYGDAADEEDEDGEPIFISPNSYWTPGEKHLFFQSLSRHSRLRPDLIAATVGTKSVLEVCQLLRVLCDAARDVGEDLHDAKRRRVEMEAAVEVSDDWLAFEDIRAQEHINGEADWELAAILATRKRSQQARGGTKRKRGAGEERSTNPKPPSQEAQAAAWKLDDALKNLDVPHLQVLDSLVRTAEEAAPLSPGPSSSRPSRSNSVQPPTEPSSPSPLAEETVIRMTSAERRRLHKRMYMRRRRARETGGVVVDDIARLKPGRRKKTDGVGTPSNAHDAIGSPSEAAPVELSRGGINPNAAADDSPEEDLDSGSAAEPAKQSTKQRGKVVREKAQALFAEAGVDAAMLLRDGLDLFQMSRFGRLSQLYTHALFERTTGGQPPDAADLPPDQDGTGTNNQAQSNNHDDTCDESGDDDGRIAAAATPEQEQEQDVPPIPHPTLHYTTFQLLRAYVVAYVASLVHGAVVSAEQDKRIKEHTKVWRGNFNLIKAEHVAHAVDTVGSTKRVQDKASFFKELPERIGAKVVNTGGTRGTRVKGKRWATESDDEEVEDGEDEDADEDEEDRVSDREHGSVDEDGADEDEDGYEDDVIMGEPEGAEREATPTRYQIHPPFLWHPALFLPSSETHNPDSGRGHVSGLKYVDVGVDGDNDSNEGEEGSNSEIYSTELFASSLATEMAEEAKLARKDARRDVAEENKLWRYFGIKRHAAVKRVDSEERNGSDEDEDEDEDDVGGNGGGDEDGDGDGQVGTGQTEGEMDWQEEGGVSEEEGKPARKIRARKSARQKLKQIPATDRLLRSAGKFKSAEYIIDSSDSDSDTETGGGGHGN